MRKSFIVHNDSLGVLDDLTESQCGELFRAIRAYQLGESIDLSPIVKIAFSPFRNQFDRDDIKYEKTCQARADAGSKGGKQKAANVASASNCKQTVAKLADSVSKSKSDSDSDSKSKSESKSESKSKSKTLDQSAIDHERMFDEFWASGIRKVNKKKSKSLFNNLLKKQPCGWTFTNRLTADIQTRLNANQLGFAEMHPTTYLNGERWNDEVTTNGNQNRSHGATGPNRQSTVDRVRATNAANRASRADNRNNLGNADGHLREHPSEPIRGCDAGSMDSVIEGTFTHSDEGGIEQTGDS